MSNAERFIEIYNQVDQFLNENVNADGHENFRHKVKKCDNPIIKKHKEKLYDYADLRNVLVYKTRYEDKIIAEPLPDVVDDFHEILQTLIAPKKVFPLFSSTVIGAKLSDKLDEILRIMRTNSFSQIPIFNEQQTIVEVINTNTISRWIGSQIEGECIITENPCVDELIGEIEYKIITNLFQGILIYIQLLIALSIIL